MNNGFIADTPDKIDAVRLLSMKGRLKLEVAGMKFRGRSTYSIIKSEFNLKGTKQRVLDQFIEILKQRGILVDPLK